MSIGGGSLVRRSLVCILLLGSFLVGGIRVVSDSKENHRDFDWYKTQFGTGGTGNCGPACAAMAIYWAKGENISVRKMRDEIGDPYGNRATTLANQKWAIENHGVPTRYTYPESVRDLKEIIRRGHIAILWIHTGRISKPKGDVTQTKIGRYYDDECGHYVVLKGMSPNERYFIIHDPIPGDWRTNTVRYDDGGMLGRNRYFPVTEVWSSLMERKVVEVLGIH
jgi:hypothetical protein